MGAAKCNDASGCWEEPWASDNIRPGLSYVPRDSNVRVPTAWSPEGTAFGDGDCEEVIRYNRVTRVALVHCDCVLIRGTRTDMQNGCVRTRGEDGVYSPRSLRRTQPCTHLDPGVQPPLGEKDRL